MKSSTPEEPQGMEGRNSRDLLIASKEFASENRWTSWGCLGSTLLAIATLFSVTVSSLPYIVRIPCSFVLGFALVRLFVIYHDFQHEAILKNSKFAQFVMWVYGLLSLNPPSVWNRSHDHHHTHNSKTFGPNTGSYPIITTDAYQDLLGSEKLRYGVSRHPLTMLLGYVTVFFGVCRFDLFSRTQHDTSMRYYRWSPTPQC